jgi:DNA-binding IclR family transcriptional regulator
MLISAPRTPRIQSLARASAILDIIARQGKASLADISAATGLNKSTAFYLVESLADLDFAERLPDRKGYCLGLRNLELGRAVQRRLDIVGLSRASLIRLCQFSKETVNLAVPHVFDAMIVESLEGAYGVRATSYAGSRAAYHSTACGKAILAFLEVPVRQAIYDARGLPAVTANTITQKDKLEDQLATIRNEGYAIDSEENETGANCVAAPIHDGLGEIAGSISVSGLASRMDRTKLVNLATIIVEEASAISILLGNRAGSQPRNGRAT